VIFFNNMFLWVGMIDRSESLVKKYVNHIIKLFFS
jgi:hypothetical protein